MLMFDLYRLQESLRLCHRPLPPSPAAPVVRVPVVQRGLRTGKVVRVVVRHEHQPRQIYIKYVP